MKPEEAIKRIKNLMKGRDDPRGKTELDFALDMAIEALKKPHGECRTCKHYAPYREQFSYRHRGDGYCKRAVTTADGEAYMNCHDEWYCANYEKEGEAE